MTCRVNTTYSVTFSVYQTSSLHLPYASHNKGVSGGEEVDTKIAYVMAEERRDKIGGDTDT